MICFPLESSGLTDSSLNCVTHFLAPNTEIVFIWIQTTVDESRHCVRHHPNRSVRIHLWTNSRKQLMGMSSSRNRFTLHSNRLDKSLSGRCGRLQHDFLRWIVLPNSSKRHHWFQLVSKIWRPMLYRKRASHSANSVLDCLKTKQNISLHATNHPNLKEREPQNHCRDRNGSMPSHSAARV